MFIHSLTLKVNMFLPSGHENETERWRQIDRERRLCDFCTGSLTTKVSGSSPKMNVYFLPSHCFRLRLTVFIGISEYCGNLLISHSSLQCWALLVWPFFFLEELWTMPDFSNQLYSALWEERRRNVRLAELWHLMQCPLTLSTLNLTLYGCFAIQKL